MKCLLIMGVHLGRALLLDEHVAVLRACLDEQSSYFAPAFQFQMRE